MIDRAHIGRTFPPFETEVERGRLRTFAKAVGETDPVYFDDAAARAAGHRAMLAPPTFAFCFGFDDPAGMTYLHELGIPIPRMLHGEELIRTHRPICVGDRVRCTRRVGDIYQKKNGALEFVVFETEVRNVATEELVAELRSVLVIRNPT
jgi:acyl dehydratase